jgi:anti-anti-sigma factor
MPYLRVKAQTIGFRRVLSLRGEIDIGSAGILRSALEQALESGLREVWADLSEVRFLDSSGLNALVKADHAFVARHRQLVIICPVGPVRRTLELTGLDRELNVLGSRGEAQRLS